MATAASQGPPSVVIGEEELEQKATHTASSRSSGDTASHEGGLPRWKLPWQSGPMEGPTEDHREPWRGLTPTQLDPLGPPLLEPPFLHIHGGRLSARVKELTLGESPSDDFRFCCYYSSQDT